MTCSTTDVAIIGGGVVGVIAANRMRERCIDYRVIERLHDFGGVWHTHSNNHSTLQVPLVFVVLQNRVDRGWHRIWVSFATPTSNGILQYRGLEGAPN